MRSQQLMPRISSTVRRAVSKAGGPHHLARTSPSWHVTGQMRHGHHISSESRAQSRAAKLPVIETSQLSYREPSCPDTPCAAHCPSTTDTMATPLFRSLMALPIRQSFQPFSLSSVLSQRSFSTTPSQSATLNQVLRVRLSSPSGSHCPPY
jgi:hypothetical protein